MRYPNTIRAHREERGLTQWTVAKAVDINPTRFSRIEHGQSQVSYAEGVRLANFFGVPPADLFPTVDASAVA